MVYNPVAYKVTIAGNYDGEYRLVDEGILKSVLETILPMAKGRVKVEEIEP